MCAFENEEAWPSSRLPGGFPLYAIESPGPFYGEMKEQQSKVLILTLEPSAGG